MGRARIQWLRGFVLAAIFVIPTLAHAQDTWTQVGTQSSNRTFLTLTALADGRVLIVGGVSDFQNPVALNTVDINDPGPRTTVAGPPLAVARLGHSAMRLPDGRVLVVGGTDATSHNVLAVEIYNPATNSWSPGAPMTLGATLPGMSLLADGRVLVTGTDTINGQGTGADIYDPASNSWAAATAPSGPHIFPAVVTLPDGRVLVVGGNFSTTAEIYDPVLDTWTATGAMAITDYGFGSVHLTASGRAIHVSTVLYTEFLDLSTSTWTAGASMFPTPTEAYSAQAQLADGRIIAAGGGDLIAVTAVDLATTKIYDPVSDSWSTGAPMLSTHAMTQFAKLPNGRFVIAGSLTSPTTVIEMTGPNTAPAANAGPDLNASTCNACIGGVAVSAAGTIDAEGDAITYIWSLGATVLATTTQPSVILSLPAGTNVVTLTARDSFGAEGTDTVTISMTNVDDAYTAAIASLQAQVLTLQDTITTLQGQVATLTSSNAILVAQLATCQAAGGGDITPLLDAFEQYMRTRFHDAAFELPGTTSISELQNLINALERLDKDAQKKLYRALGGHKMHPAHKGRPRPHWDDDCDWDDDRR